MRGNDMTLNTDDQIPSTLIKKHFQNESKQLSAFFNYSDSHMILYGAGGIGQETCDFLSDQGLIIDIFIDANAKPGDCYNGIPIVRPENLNIGFDKSRLVIITIFNAFVDITAVRGYLKEAGFSKIMTYVEFYSYFSANFTSKYWLRAKEFYRGKECFVDDSYSAFEEKRSRHLYKSILEFRLTDKYNDTMKPDEGLQYFDNSIPGLTKPSVFLDCGAFDGDTLNNLYAHFGKIENIIAFEPDHDNFNKLSAWVKFNRENIADKITLFPCGVWSSTKQLNFLSGMDGGSGVSSNTTNSLIQCISLDEVLVDIRPSFIKMDIEGAEYDALLGAKELIMSNKPILAISIYHKAEHLWMIPLLLKSWGLDYKFYLRCYCYSGFDLILYAI
jgi:FkbM family methyltransferase